MDSINLAVVHSTDAYDAKCMSFVIHNVYHSCVIVDDQLLLILLLLQMLCHISPGYFPFSIVVASTISLTFTNSFDRILLAANIVTMHINLQAIQIRPKQHQSIKKTKNIPELTVIVLEIL